MQRRGGHGQKAVRTLTLSLLLVGSILIARQPAVIAAPAVGPAFAASGEVITPLRPNSDDFATAVVVQPDGQLVLAAGAGGDFGLARVNQHLHPGALFGPQDGKVTTDFGGTVDIPRSVALTAAGRVVAAGSAGPDLAVAVYDANGILDRAFDGDGRLTADLGGPDDSAHAVLTLSDERLLVVGGTPSSVVVLRLLADGRPDVTYGRGGRVTVPATGPGRAAVLQADGKLLVAGGGTQMVVHRFLADGSLDPTFGVGGVASVPTPGGAAVARAVVLAPDDTITVAGARGGDVAAARLTPTGHPDITFGSAGVTVTSIGLAAGAHGLFRDPDGSLVAVGDAGDSGLIVRYRPDGSLDPGFGSGGYTVTASIPTGGSYGSAFRAVVPHFDDGWVVAGHGAANAVLFRVQAPSGTAYFGNASVDWGIEYQRVTASVTQPDGKLVALEEAGGDVVLVRYNPDGTRDGDFGVSGIVVSDRASFPRAVAVQPGGRIIVAAAVVPGTPTAAVLGFRPDGSLDTAFGDDGRALVDVTGNLQYGSSIVVLPDGRLVMAADSSGGGSLARLTVDGALDTTFGQGGRVLGAYPSYAGAESGILLQPGGRILAGNGGSVLAFTPDGAHDLSFGVDGKVGFGGPDFPSGQIFGVQPDGRILLSGITRVADGILTISRLLPDGARDPSWHPPADPQRGPGDNYPFELTPSTLTVQGDGTVLVGGVTNNSLGVARILPDGLPDTTFGIGGFNDLRRTPGSAPVAVVSTAAAGMLLVATNGSPSYPTDGLLIARVATGQLGAPTAVTAVGGSGSARVRWTRPALFDESPIQAYTVTASDGVHTTTTPDAGHFSAVIRGLTPGQSYTFTVHAVRSGGNSPASLPSSSVAVTLSGPLFMGMERAGPARGRLNRRSPPAGDGRGCSGSGGLGRRRLPQRGPPGRWHGVGLGLEPLRPAGRRLDDLTADPGASCGPVRRDCHLDRGFPQPRPPLGRNGLGVGLERGRPAGYGWHRRQPGARSGGRPQRDQGHQRRLLPQRGGAGRWHGGVLGLELLRTAGRRNYHRPSSAHRGHWADRCDRGGCRRAAHRLPRHRHQGPGMGLQRTRRGRDR